MAMAVKMNRIRAPKPRPAKSKPDYSNTCCEKCGSGKFDDELLLCDKCDRGYHLFCLRPVMVSVPKGSWFCPSCSIAKNKDHYKFPLTQTKIVDFFRIQRHSELAQNVKVTQENKKKRKRTVNFSSLKKRRRLLPYIPTEDPTRRLEQMASLATALTSTGADYRNELTYMPGMAPRSANSAALEHGGMQVLSKEDCEALNLCKRMMERGECPPLMVVYDPIEGYTVEADRLIKDLTIITEYVGDVDYLKKRENDDGDSIMTLLYASDPSRSLVICPDNRSNIARFINGINNHTLDGKKKRNVKCVRFDVDGESRVLLIATRDISKGERLYYDYNGYEHEYPTDHFV
ncbi:histone-lysine N-methyltransferase ATXR6-like [Impatiens glandulifera]|uniref:histone-lysine N-methyltransferase ATXR6-like n=1 Tax=Impatiens glandulifera TaxID=253017 RepID=UPI001FB12DCF|nr:histone-lysine N-methyltransferase ATXR6-like [Impatiens glandulifera]